MEVGEPKADFDMERTFTVLGSSEVIRSDNATMFRKEVFHTYVHKSNKY